MTQTKPFETVVIIGVGLIGGSLGLAISRKYPGTRIIGVSSRAAVTSAREMGAITEGCGYEEMEEVVATADLIVLCTPIHRIKGLITVLDGKMKPGAVVTDVGSTKRAITEHAAAVMPDNVHFIGGHPMTGSEKRGIDAADPFLFQNAIYVLCPAANVPVSVTDTFSTYIGSIGAKVIILEAGRHDQIAAAVSHLPQLIAIGLVEMVGEHNSPTAPYLQLAAGGFRDMTRIASSPFTMWEDIYSTNTDEVRSIIDEFISHLTQLKERISTQQLGDDFEVANLTRATIPRDTKGFLRTLSEVLVVVEDKPGVISEISSVLFTAGINIKDIEVLKVREGEGGTLRLAFEQEDEAVQAITILQNIDYTARLRR